MKKSNLFFCTLLTAMSITNFSCINWSHVAEQEETLSSTSVPILNDLLNTIKEQADSDFFYDVDSRYMSTMTKEEMGHVRSLDDIFPEEQIESIVSYQSVSVTILGDNYETISIESGESEVFNDAQIKLLHTAPYSTNILIRADYVEKNRQTGKLEENYSTPHITIIPEKEAIYESGKEALINYLKKNSKEQTIIVQKYRLQPGKVHFTICRDGTISDVKLVATSGYPSIDKTMTDLITKTPGKWEPAVNAKGEKVDQELVFSFGIVGC